MRDQQQRRFGGWGKGSGDVGNKGPLEALKVHGTILGFGGEIKVFGGGEVHLEEEKNE